MSDRYFTKYLADGSRKRRGGCFGWLLAAFFLFVVGAVIVGWSAFGRMLESELFLATVSDKVSGMLGVEGRFQPLKWQGSEVFSDSYAGTGKGRKITADHIRGTVDFPALFPNSLKIPVIEMGRFVWEENAEIVLTDSAAAIAGAPSGIWLVFLWMAPAEVRFDRIEAREFSYRHAGVRVERARLAARRSGDDWTLEALGGTVNFKGNTEWDLVAARGRIGREGTLLFITESELHTGRTGKVTASAEIGSESSTVRAKFEGIDPKNHLPERYRDKVEGVVSGDVLIERAAGSTRESGSISMHAGRLTGLPVLERIAEYTRVPEFAALRVDRAGGKFERRGDRLEVENFLLESEGLLLVTGEFSVEGGRIDGHFEVGVSARSLRWLPGAQNKVFTARRATDTYLWTTMRLTGPVDAPTEDLSARLIVAAGEAGIEMVTGVAAGALDTAVGAGSSVLGVGTGLLDRVLGSKAEVPQSDPDAAPTPAPGLLDLLPLLP